MLHFSVILVFFGTLVLLQYSWLTSILIKFLFAFGFFFLFFCSHLVTLSFLHFSLEGFSLILMRTFTFLFLCIFFLFFSENNVSDFGLYFFYSSKCVFRTFGVWFLLLWFSFKFLCLFVYLISSCFVSSELSTVPGQNGAGRSFCFLVGQKYPPWESGFQICFPEL